MATRFDLLVERVRRLPLDRQEDAADVLTALVEQDEANDDFTVDQIAAIERRLFDPNDGPASGEKVSAFYRGILLTDDEIRTFVAESDASGPGLSAEVVFAELREQLVERSDPRG